MTSPQEMTRSILLGDQHNMVRRKDVAVSDTNPRLMSWATRRHRTLSILTLSASSLAAEPRWRDPELPLEGAIEGRFGLVSYLTRHFGHAL